MAKIAIFNMPALGHVNPTLDICQELSKRGHEIIYFCTEEFRAAIEHTGARLIAYESTEWGKTSDPKPGVFFQKMVRDALSIIPQILKIVAHEKPDLAIYNSMTIWGRLVSRALSRNAIRIHPTRSIY